MKPVNWNDPDLVGKKIIEKGTDRPVEITYIFREKHLFNCINENGYEITPRTDHSWYYYEEPEEEECCTWPGCENHILKGPVPEGKEPEENLKHSKGYHYFCASCYNFQVIDGDKLTNKNHTCHDCGYNNRCEEDLLKGPVPEGKKTASGLRNKKLLAPALLKNKFDGYWLANRLFSSLKKQESL